MTLFYVSFLDHFQLVTLFPCLILTIYTPPSNQRDIFKYKPYHVTLLLKTTQWLPIAFRIQYNFIIVHKVHDLPLTSSVTSFCTLEPHWPYRAFTVLFPLLCMLSPSRTLHACFLIISKASVQKSLL